MEELLSEGQGGEQGERGVTPPPPPPPPIPPDGYVGQEVGNRAWCPRDVEASRAYQNDAHEV